MKIDQVTSYRLDHLGIVAEMAKEIGLVESINAFCSVDEREIVTPGQAVLAMALNCLGFTTRALYITPHFFKSRNLKFLLGEPINGKEIKSTHLNQHKLGRTLDEIASIGPERVFLEVALRAFRQQKVSVPHLHADTTSHSFYGQYLDENGNKKEETIGNAQGEPIKIMVTHGYSKDSRPACKQMVQELLVSSDGDVPLMFQAWSGNIDDTTVMKQRIDSLKSSLISAKAEDLIPKYFIGDSKMYCRQSLEDAKRDETKWITRLPALTVDTKNIIAAAAKSKKGWIKILDVEGGVFYKEYELETYGIKQRCFVVQSDSSRRQTKAYVGKQIKLEQRKIKKIIERYKNKRFVSEKEVAIAVSKIEKKLKYHVSDKVCVEPVFQKGRPKNDLKRKTTAFAIQNISFKTNKNKIKEAEQKKACFVIGTNDTDKAVKVDFLIQTYRREQQAVERSFRFLKDPEYFADAFFLKSPRRLAALLCVMTIALLLFSLTQRKLRNSLKLKNLTIKDQIGKQTQTPTLRWVNSNFEGIDVTVIESHGEKLIHFHRIGTFEKSVLTALGPNYVDRYSEKFIS